MCWAQRQAEEQEWREENERNYIEELEQYNARMHFALKTLQQWDILNPVEGQPEFCADAPWARELIRNALGE
jgi:hypothetical protein